MGTSRSLVLAHVTVAALSAVAAAAPRARHIAEPPRQAAVDEDRDAAGDVFIVDDPEPAPAPPRAIAAAAERDPGWRAGIGVGADIPVDALNVGFVIQAPSGLRLSSSVGFLTTAFLGLMDAPGGGPEATALMHAALRDSLVWRTHLGMKPWRTHGFYAAAGYTLCSLGGAVTNGQAISAFVDEMLPAGLESIALVHMTSTLHALDVEAGWEWSIGHRITVRTAIGAAMIVDASTTIHVEDRPLPYLPLPPIDQVIAPMERAGEAEINKLYKDAGPIVMLTLQLQLDLL